MSNVDRYYRAAQPNKALQLARSRLGVCEGYQPAAARFGGRFVGRPPVVPFSSTAARS